MSDATPHQRTEAGDIYVSPRGNDDWSGRHPDPDESDGDGPFATVERAQRAVRERGGEGTWGEDNTVWLRGGRYCLDEPITFTPADTAPATYAAYPDEEPILDGGRRIEDWEETTVNGVTAWKADLPDVGDGEWYFRSLFVDGERRPRTRVPDDGFYEIEGVPHDADPFQISARSDRLEDEEGYSFYAGSEDVQSWENISDVEVVVPHGWIAERSPIRDYDPEENLVTTSLRAHRTLGEGDHYRLENLKEALSDPGEWYLDRDAGTVYYIPKANERIEDVDVVAPVRHQFLRVEGRPEEGSYVESLTFRGITFRYTDWLYPGHLPPKLRTEPEERGRPYLGYATSAQAEHVVPGAIFLTGARDCAFEDCTVEHVGLYGIQFAGGCLGNRLVGNELADLGAGGVKLEGANTDEPDARGTGRTRVTDNHIHHGGQVLHGAVGVLARHSWGNTISHNHVHEFYYGGISLGWTWDYDDCRDCNNVVAYNCVHDMGGDLVEDHHMGIYTLGVQPGTVIRGNYVYTIGGTENNGGGIHLDGATSRVRIEDNVVHDANQGINLNGSLNTVVNNVFALCRNASISGQISLRKINKDIRTVQIDLEKRRTDAASLLTSGGIDTGVTVYRNVLVSDGTPLITRPDDIESDNNLFWDVDGDVSFERHFTRGNPGRRSTGAGDATLSFEEWQDAGFDTDSLVADPAFEDLDAADFRITGESPIDRIGFDPIDLDIVGPRRDPARPGAGLHDSPGEG